MTKMWPSVESEWLSWMQQQLMAEKFFTWKEGSYILGDGNKALFHCYIEVPTCVEVRLWKWSS